MEKDEEPEVIELHGPVEGRSLLVLGGIHGDEICGPVALQRIVEEFRNGTLVAESGDVTIVPIANPRAYAQRKRLIDDNLNRVFKIWDDPNSYEKKLANKLAPLVYFNDFVLDIHSTSAPSEPTVFIDYPDKPTVDFARVLGVRNAILGWAELYGDKESPIRSLDTMRFAKEEGRWGLTVECGQHNDPNAQMVAYNSVLGALRRLKIITGPTSREELTAVRMREMYVRENVDDHFTQEWKHMDAFVAGDELAIVGGAPVRAAFDGYILLPKRNAPIGTEWFYTGVAEEAF